MHKSLLLIISFLFSVIVHLTTFVQASELDEDSARYLSSNQQMMDVERLLETAKSNNKLALIVMGANWCHDSRSLASKLYLPEMKNVIDNHYELLFVDVGYFTNIKKVITRFNMPVIYATPTVLIIDPVTGERINGHNMHIWRNADSVSVEDTFQYFSDIANQSRVSTLAIGSVEAVGLKQQEQLLHLNQLINDFEKIQSKRLYKAFAIIGPLLKEKNEGGKAKNFGKYWKAVSAFRYKITDDLALLREKAIRLTRENSKEKLLFPQYPAFEWE
jgi:hypothetical protein